MGADTFFAQIASQPCKDKLRANTDELIERGGYGSPTMFVNGDDMYFGNDRLPLVERALHHSATDHAKTTLMPSVSG
jgi:2-hydroxychromene-2-carboxylate isomerase